MKEINCSKLSKRILKMCKKRNWDLHWTARGAYLHLEASELIESLRGKGDSTPTEEAADVLLVLMSITAANNIDFDDVLKQAEKTCKELETKPRYHGELYRENNQ